MSELADVIAEVYDAIGPRKESSTTSSADGEDDQNALAPSTLPFSEKFKEAVSLFSETMSIGTARTTAIFDVARFQNEDSFPEMLFRFRLFETRTDKPPFKVLMRLYAHADVAAGELVVDEVSSSNKIESLQLTAAEFVSKCLGYIDQQMKLALVRVVYEQTRRKSFVVDFLRNMLQDRKFTATAMQTKSSTAVWTTTLILKK